MRASALASALHFSARFEGTVPHMYLDVRGLVTCAIGNLIDPMEEALHLPFSIDGRRATRAEICAEWLAVKSMRHMAQAGGGAFAGVTKLRLSDQAMADLFGDTVDNIGDRLRQRWTAFEAWPASAQLATFSMAYAMGSQFAFPRFSDAARIGDFAAMAVECRMDDSHNPGLVPRNAANRALFLEAAAVVAAGADYDVLHWPQAFAP